MKWCEAVCKPSESKGVRVTMCVRIGAVVSVILAHCTLIFSDLSLAFGCCAHTFKVKM